VELSLLLPIFLVLVFGLLELSTAFGDWLLLANASREGSRSAAVGRTTTLIRTATQQGARPLSAASVQVAMAYRTSPTGAWTTLGDTAGHNNAPVGSQVRITVTYLHRMMTGSMLSRLSGGPTRSSMPLTTMAVVRRE
jgi:Flp pilus assembly protein TadG